MPATLPAYGWTSHAEQTDAASLEAQAWAMATVTTDGSRVMTTLLHAPPPDSIEKIEIIAARHRQHGCDHEFLRLCPDGKFDPKVTFFYTMAFDASGLPFVSLRAHAFDPATAKANHFAAVAMLVGAVSSWAPHVESTTA